VLGLRGATLWFGGLNLACAAMLVGMSRRLPAHETPRQLKARPVGGPPAVELSPRRLALTSALTGLLGLGLEVVVTRELALVLEGTVYTFAAVLVVFLGGTAVGAVLGKGARCPTGRLLLWLALAILAAGHALTHAADLNRWLRNALGDGLGAVFIAESGVATSVLIAPTLLMGAVFARLAQAAADTGFGVGRVVGLNTLGSALAGPVFAVLLLPSAGAKATFLILSAGYLALGIRRWATGSAMAVVTAALVGAALPADFGLLPPPPGARLIERTDGAADTVTVWEFPDGNRTLAANGRFTMGGTASTNAAARHSLLPLLLHPRPRRLLFLGLGTGISFAAAGAEPGLTADGVELVPEVIAAQAKFAPHSTPTAGQRIVNADARRFVRASTDSYDVIVADLFHPARDGAGALYTREQFAALRARLAPGGLAVQWLPLYQLDAATLRPIVRAFLGVFPDTHAWLLRFNADTPVLGLIGWPDAPQFREHDFERRASDAKLRARLKAAGLSDGFQLAGGWLAGPAALRAFAGDARPNSDDRPEVIFAAPRFTARQHADPAELLLELLDRFAGEGVEFPADGTPADTAKWRARLAEFRAARDGYLRGLVADAMGRPDEAAEHFWASVRRSADFSGAYAQLLTRAMAKAKTSPGESRRMLRALAEARPEQPVAAELLRRLE
jgi:spermidine synthase